jgi:hypothetical protein
MLIHQDVGFTSNPKEVVRRILIAFKNPLSSAEYEPANLVSNGKHDNYYTTEKDTFHVYFIRD